MNARTYRILVLETSPADVYIIKEAFQECGYECQLNFVTSQVEARQHLEMQSFDLLIADFRMLIEQAIDFVDGVHRLAPRLPIVMLSGNPDHNLAYEAGANAFVRKEGDLTEFFEKIQGMMHFWAEIAELPDYNGRPFSTRSFESRNSSSLVVVRSSVK